MDVGTPSTAPAPAVPAALAVAPPKAGCVRARPGWVGIEAPNGAAAAVAPAPPNMPAVPPPTPNAGAAAVVAPNAGAAAVVVPNALVAPVPKGLGAPNAVLAPPNVAVAPNAEGAAAPGAENAAVVAGCAPNVGAAAAPNMGGLAAGAPKPPVGALPKAGAAGCAPNVVLPPAPPAPKLNAPPAGAPNPDVGCAPNPLEVWGARTFEHWRADHTRARRPSSPPQAPRGHQRHRRLCRHQTRPPAMRKIKKTGMGKHARGGCGAVEMLTAPPPNAGAVPNAG